MENGETGATISKANLPSPHERLMAVLAHLSIFVPWFGGVIAFAFWMVNLHDAKYAAFQAKQACIFQVVVYFICGFSTLFWTILGRPYVPVLPQPGLLDTLNFLLHLPWIYVPVMLVAVFACIYGLTGAIYCAWGLPFRYGFIAVWLRK